MLRPNPHLGRDFSLAQARRLIGDLFTPNPWVYWTDFLLSWSVGLACFSLVRRLPQVWEGPPTVVLATQGMCFVASCLLFYRASLFIHELIHLRAGEFQAFRFVWNLLCGIPFLIPSFVYYTHIDHHRRKHYGTSRDGEYLSLSHQPTRNIVWYVLGSLVIPALAVARFLVFTPLSWICPPFRRWLLRHASSMVMDPTYIRPLPTAATLRTIRLQETLCFLWCLGFAIGIAMVGQWPYPLLLQAYATGVFIVLLNSIRTLGAHRWTNKDDAEMTFVEQLLDSVNYPHRAWATELWGPIGTRYHALHHLFPTLPYHQMPAAHRRLMASLPADSPYRQTNEVTLTAALMRLWRRAGASSAAAKTGPEPPISRAA